MTTKLIFKEVSIALASFFCGKVTLLSRHGLGCGLMGLVSAEDDVVWGLFFFVFPLSKLNFLWYNCGMNRKIELLVTANENGIKTEYFLRRHGIADKLIRKLKTYDDGITLNGEVIFTNHKLVADDKVVLHFHDEAGSEGIVATKMDIDVVFEDEDLLVVNKAAGLAVHPSKGNFDKTLANGVMYYYASKGFEFTFRAVNRLDRDTTGLLIIAKNPYSAAKLSEMMKKREIHRTYLAIVEGDLPESGTINLAIGRVGDSVLRQVDENGEAAVTHFEKVEHKNGLTLVKLQLETGRTHQIRVHMKHLGNPLVGDFLYNPKCNLMNRQGLHSYKLTLRHPVTGENLEFVADVPEDMKNCFK